MALEPQSWLDITAGSPVPAKLRNQKATPKSPVPETVLSREMYYIAEDIATEITPMNIDVFAVKTLKIECDTVTIPAAGVAAIEVTIE